MKAIVILALISFAAASSLSKRTPQRIIGGAVTTINQWPMAASLLFSENLSVYWQTCGGTIINNRSILSAAHCFFGHSAAQWRSRVGSSFANSGGTVYNVNKIVMHPNYIEQSLDNDIAILQAPVAFEFSETVSVGNIAGVNYNVNDNVQVYAIGWGSTDNPGQPSEQLQQVQIWAVNQNICKDRYAIIGTTITDNMLCSGWLDVGGRDQCAGDSGGPLFHEMVIVGVRSFSSDCGNAKYPGVNTRVSQYTNWIQDNA